MDHAASSSAPPVVVDSRISKVLELRTDSVAMLEALDAISEFYTSNTLEARRSLRQDLELQNITLAKKFLQEYSDVKERVSTIENISLNLKKSCNELTNRIITADENMKLFMSKATELETNRNNYMKQSEEISLFLNRFQLSPEEVDMLYRAPIDDNQGKNSFFGSLNRLQTAYNDCKQMVDQYSHSAGYELLDILGQHQNIAYQRLFDWLKIKCEVNAESSSAGDIDNTTQLAIKYLRSVPMFVAQCQDIVINSRRSQLVQRFVVALTQGGSGGRISRAMDLHAHESTRYVGDMLAWMHQAVASEEELLQVLFGSTSGTDALPIPELLARCLQGLGRPLRVRIMQTLESRIPLQTLYSLTDLLVFYETTFHKVVPVENSVHSAVKGCLLESRRLFTAALNKQSEMLTTSPASYPLDLSPSSVTKECTKQIQEIFRIYSSALSSALADPEDSCYVNTIIGMIIHPLLQSCRVAGQPLHKSDMSIFMLNNVISVRNELVEVGKRSSINSSPTKVWIDTLEQESATWLDILVQEEVSRTLHRSDLDKLLEFIELVPTGIVASEQPGLSPDRVSTVMRAFYASLFSTVTPSYDKLLDPELRETIRRKTAEAISNGHARIHAIISNDSNNYDKSMLIHSVEEVKVLLGC